MRTSRVDWLRFSSCRERKEKCVECWQFSKFTAHRVSLGPNNGNLCPPFAAPFPIPASSCIPRSQFNLQSGFRSSLRSGCPSCRVEWRFTWLQLILFPQLCSNANSTFSSCQHPPPPGFSPSLAKLFCGIAQIQLKPQNFWLFVPLHRCWRKASKERGERGDCT